jgi:hypothetical protein
MKWLWPTFQRDDVRAVILLIAIVGVLGIFVFALGVFPGKFPNIGRPLNPNTGFGAGWECVHTGAGDPVCLKRLPQSK